jgi:DNA-binding LytR/AlgR family response regulator
VKIFFNDIILAEAVQNYVNIYTTEKKYITYLTFKSVEEYLPQDRFIKTHKSYIVSVQKVDSIEGNDIKLAEHHVPISRNLKEEVMEKLLGNKFLKR